MMSRRDSLTLDMFEVPVARTPIPGGLAVGAGLRGLLADSLKSSPLNRFEVAAKMSELLGHEITKHQLDAWAAESRENWRFPLEYLPALEEALQTHGITQWLADLRGCKLLVGKEAIDAEIGKLERLREESAKRIRQLKQAMGELA
jgi:hypothetical protein